MKNIFLPMIVIWVGGVCIGLSFGVSLGKNDVYHACMETSQNETVASATAYCTKISLKGK